MARERQEGRLLLSIVAVIAVASPACGSGAGPQLDAGDEPSRGPPDASDELVPADASASGDAEAGSTSDTGRPDTSTLDAGSCCTRSPSYDATCSGMSQPPVAYLCFCPGGGINPSCTINMGSEIVCCP